MGKTFAKVDEMTDSAAILAAVESGTVVVWASQNVHPQQLQVIVDGAVRIDVDAASSASEAIEGINQLADANFENGAGSWTTDAKGHVVECDLPGYVLEGGHTLYFKQTAKAPDTAAELVYCDPIDGQFLPIKPETTYQFSGLFGAHRCTLTVRVQLFGPDGSEVARYEQPMSTRRRAGSGVGDYDTFSLSFQPPKGAFSARLSLIKSEKSAGADSYLFLARPWFGLSDADAVRPWAPCLFSPRTMAAFRASGGGRVLRTGLPLSLLDGRVHQISLRWAETDCDVEGSPIRYDTSILGFNSSARGNQPAPNGMQPDERRCTTSIIFFPDYRATNPYQKLLYRRMPDLASAVPGNVADAVALLQGKPPGARVVLHLHWLHPILAGAKTELEAEFKKNAFLDQLRYFTHLGGVLVWTIHNVISHDAKFSEVERDLCSTVAQLADVVHIHSWRTFPEITEAYKVPRHKVLEVQHPSYEGYYLNYVDRNVARARLGLPQNGRVLLFLGQLRPYKGIEELVAAFSAIANDPETRLLIVGSPVHPYGKGQLSRRFRAFRNVQVLEARVPDDELQWYFKAADWTVLPYRNILTSGSLLCALSMGCPVVAPDLGAIADVLKDNFNGILYDPIAPDGLLTAVSRAVAMPEPQLAAIRGHSAESVRHLTWDNFGATLLNAMNSARAVRTVTLPFDDKPRDCLLAGATFPPEQPKRVAAIILNYGNIDDTQRLCASLRASDSKEVDIYVVDNCSPGVQLREIVSQIPDTIILRTPENLGYAAGNNAALRLISHLGYEYFWILNPDTVVPPNALSGHLAAAAALPDADVIGPAVCHGARPDTVASAGGYVSFSNGVATGHLYSGVSTSALPREPFAADYLTGASLFIKSSSLEKFGTIPEHYFLYFEETDWCLRASEAGLKCIVVPDLIVYHHKRSEHKNLPAKYYFYYYVRNLLRFCKRFSPSSVVNAEERLREDFINPWLARIQERAPEALPLYQELARRGVADGLSDVAGQIDLLRLEAEILIPGLGPAADEDTIGYAQVSEDGVVNGWVMNRKRFDQQYHVSAVVGDELLLTTKADETVLNANVPHIVGAHGFTFALPPQMRNGQPIELVLRANGTEVNGVAAFRQLVFLPKPPHAFNGRIDGLSQYRCSGWVADSSDPTFHPVVELLSDGNVIARATADEYRDDLRRAGINNGKAGFVARLPRRFSDGQRHELLLRVVDTTNTLFRREVRDHFVGDSEPPNQSIPGMLSWLHFHRQIWLSRQAIDELPFGRYIRSINRMLASKYESLPQTTTVSVVMPAFNRAKTITESIQSVMAQSYRNWELLIVDDGSSDGTADVVRTLLAKDEDPRIRLLAMPHNAGVSAARNAGLSASKGTVIAYLDSDNTWDPDFLSVMVNELLANSGALSAYCGQEIRQMILDGDEQVAETIGLRLGPFDLAILENRNFIDLNCFVHHRRLYERLEGFNERMSRLVDWELILRYATASTPHFVPTALSSYYFDKADNQITKLSGFDDNLARLAATADKLTPEPIEDRERTDASLRPVEIVVLCTKPHADELGPRLQGIAEASQSGMVSLVAYLPTSELLEPLSRLCPNFTLRVYPGPDEEGVLADAVDQLRFGHDLVIMTDAASPAAGWLTRVNRAIERTPDGAVFVTRRMIPGSLPEARKHAPFAHSARFVNIALSAVLQNVLDPELDRQENLAEISHFEHFCTYVRSDVAATPGIVPDGPLPLHDQLQHLAAIARGPLGLKLVHCARAVVFDLSHE